MTVGKIVLVVLISAVLFASAGMPKRPLNGYDECYKATALTEARAKAIEELSQASRASFNATVNRAGDEKRIQARKRVAKAGEQAQFADYRITAARDRCATEWRISNPPR